MDQTVAQIVDSSEVAHAYTQQGTFEDSFLFSNFQDRALESGLTYTTLLISRSLEKNISPFFSADLSSLSRE